jgi:hypothetical protein
LARPTKWRMFAASSTDGNLKMKCIPSSSPSLAISAKGLSAALAFVPPIRLDPAQPAPDQSERLGETRRLSVGIAAARGYGAPETTEAFARARESAAGDWGLWVGCRRSPRRSRCSRPPWRKRRRSQSPRRQPESVHPRRSTRSRCCSCGRDGCSARPQAPECGGPPSVFGAELLGCRRERPRPSNCEKVSQIVPILTWLLFPIACCSLTHSIGSTSPPI